MTEVIIERIEHDWDEQTEEETQTGHEITVVGYDSSTKHLVVGGREFRVDRTEYSPDCLSADEGLPYTEHLEEEEDTFTLSLIDHIILCLLANPDRTVKVTINLDCHPDPDSPAFGVSSEHHHYPYYPESGTALSMVDFPALAKALLGLT